MHSSKKTHLVWRRPDARKDAALTFARSFFKRLLSLRIKGRQAVANDRGEGKWAINGWCAAVWRCVCVCSRV
jgi:hypothetical protein